MLVPMQRTGRYTHCTMTLLLWPLAISALLGLILLVRGWRGRRIDDHPLCRRCGYDLVASAQATNCPECGRDLTQPGAIRIGHRRRRRVALTFGIVLLLAALGGGGFLGWSRASNFNWYPYKPLWLLRQDAAGTNPTKAVASQREIIMRLTAAKLSKEQIDGIVSEALAAQSNMQATWHSWWGDFIEYAWQQGSVSEQNIIQYARTAVETSYELEIPERVRPRSMLMVGSSHAAKRAGNTGLLMAEVQSGPVRMEDGMVLSSGGGRSRSSISGGNTGRSASGSTIDLPVGKHVASSDATVRIYPAASFMSTSIGEVEPSATPPAPLVEFTMRMEKGFEVVPDDQEIVERFTDASLEPAIRAATTIRTIMAARMPRGTTILCDVDIRNPPVGVAFEVFVRVGEREWPWG